MRNSLGKITINPSSITKFNSNMHMQKDIVTVACMRALDNVSEVTFSIAQERTPVKSGALKRSGKLTKEDNAKMLKRIISYGDENTNPMGIPTKNYAVKRHETPGPHYKWLENTVRDAGSELLLDEVARLIAEQLRR